MIRVLPFLGLSAGSVAPSHQSRQHQVSNAFYAGLSVDQASFSGQNYVVNQHRKNLDVIKALANAPLTISDVQDYSCPDNEYMEIKFADDAGNRYSFRQSNAG